MAFTVDDFQDLVSLLEQRPEWRAALRRLVLSDDWLELPGIVRENTRAIDELRGGLAELRVAVGELAEAQRRTEIGLAELRVTVAGLAEAQRRTEAGLAELRGIVAELAEAQRRTEVGLGELRRELAQYQDRTDARLDRVEASLVDVSLDQKQMRDEQKQMRDDLNALRGSDRERHYRDNAGALFDDLVRRPSALSRQDLTDLIDDERASAPFTRVERREILDADIVVRGRRWEDGQEVYLVVEVSVGMEPSDVERAVRRAALLSRVRPALPVVAGDRLLPSGADLARARGVWAVVGGRAIAPTEG